MLNITFKITHFLSNSMTEMLFLHVSFISMRRGVQSAARGPFAAHELNLSGPRPQNKNGTNLFFQLQIWFEVDEAKKNLSLKSSLTFKKDLI